MEHRHRFRWVSVSSDGTQIGVSPQLLLRALLAVLSAQTNAIELIDAFRIRSIEIWAPITSAGVTPPQISLLWLGGGFSKDKLVENTSSSTSRPPYIRTTPPRMSAASFWHGSSTDTVAIFAFPNTDVGTLVDIEMDIVLNTVPAQTTTIASSAGNTMIMYGRLDGSSGIYLAQVGDGAGIE